MLTSRFLRFCSTINQISACHHCTLSHKASKLNLGHRRVLVKPELFSLERRSRPVSFWPVVSTAVISGNVFFYSYLIYQRQLDKAKVRPAKLSKELIEIADKVAPSVVRVQTFVEDLYSRPLRWRSLGSGQGFVFHQDGFIITSSAVVKDVIKSTQLIVSFADGSKHEGLVVYTNENLGLSVIKIDRTNLNALVASSNAPETGHTLITINDPQNHIQSLSAGIVNDNQAELTSSESGLRSDIKYVRSTLTTNFESCGGPVVNLAGQVAGVNHGLDEMFSYSIPVAIMEEFASEFRSKLEKWMPQLKSQSDESKSDVNPVPRTRRFIGVDVELIAKIGLKLIAICKDSPADQSGLKVDDVISAINGSPIKFVTDLHKAIESSLAVNLHIVRGNSLLRIKVELEQLKFDEISSKLSNSK